MRLSLVLACGLLAANAPNAFADDVPCWGVFEAELSAGQEYRRPLADVSPRVRFTAPDGRSYEVDAFWDGGKTWRARFSPDAAGTWKWQSVCENPRDDGLHGKSGEFTAVAGRARGPIQVAENGRHFERADGSPFFWLADTAWNGVLRSTEDGWARYLKTRSEQKFTAVQFVSTQWRGGRQVLDKPVYVGENPVSVNPDVFRRMDQRVRAINAAGMVAVPVMLWALQEDDPGEVLSVDDAVLLARYIQARWGAYDVVWFLGGDGRYPDAERWKSIARRVFPDRDEKSPMFRLVTLHPSGQSWIHGKFGGEKWLDFIGYQSGHGDGEGALRWHTAGPPVNGWREKPTRPVVNIEPNYEAHPAYESRKPHTPHHVRRAAYWSLLISPPAGVTYGHNAIWPWNEKTGLAEGHRGLGEVPPWTEGLQAEGAKDMAVLRTVFQSGPWTELRPAPNVVRDAQDGKNPERFAASARTDDKRWTVIYLPVGREIEVDCSGVPRPAVVNWVNPRTGEKRPAGDVGDKAMKVTPPDGEDWLLEIRGR